MTVDKNNLSPYLNKSSRDVFGKVLVDLAETDERIIAITAEVSNSVRLDGFKKRWPHRFFDFGIAEQNMMAAAAGFARSGKIPYVSLYAIFATLRAAEQVRTDVAYGNLPVRICPSHSGISLGEGGPSHHTIEDISFYRSLPNMTVIVPADGIETAMALRATAGLAGPVYLRLSRAPEPVVYTEEFNFTIGEARTVRKGNDVTLIAYGASVGNALKTAEILMTNSIDCRVIDMATIKPIDKQAIISAASETDAILSIEEHSIIGGLGSAVAEVLAEAGINIKFKRLGIPDEFTLAGPYPELQKYYHLDGSGIAKRVQSFLKE